MVKKPFRGNYLEMKVRISYDKKTDTVHLTSNDKDLPSDKGFHLTLNGGKEAEYALRGLMEKEGLIPAERFKTIPEKAHFSDSERHDKWDEFPLGIYATGEEVIWNPSVSPHILLVGGTGSGKSVLQRNLLLHCIQHSGQWQVLGIDLKKVELSPYAKYDKAVLGVATSLEDANEAILFAHEHMMARYQEMEEVGVNNYRDLKDHPKAIMLMVDEAFMLLTKTGIKTPQGQAEDNLKDAMHEKLTEISRLGRAAGIHLVISTQKLNADFLYGEFKMNLSTQIAAGRMDMDASKRYLGNHAATKLPGIRGRGYFQEFGRGADFQGYFSESDWLEKRLGF